MYELAACKEKYNGVARKSVEAIELKLKGYESTEIAEHYDTSVNNVNAWLSRARSKLRNEQALDWEVTNQEKNSRNPPSETQSGKEIKQ